MKIKHLLLLLLLALCAPWAANGQNINVSDPLTVNNGTDQYSSVPFLCGRISYGTNSQFILPQETITAMRGGTITNLTFYSTKKNGDFGSARFSVYMAEVTYTEFTQAVLADWDAMTPVYTGELSINNDKKMEIELDSPFTYYGGNLMIGFREDTLGTDFSNSSWYGTYTSNYPALTSNVYPNYVEPFVRRYQFLPKTTFEYYVLDLPTVDVTVGDVTPNTASLSWTTPNSEVTSYQYQYNKASEGFAANWVGLSPAATSVTLEGLDPVTDYTFRIKVCYGTHESAMTIVDFRTSCPDYTSVPYYEDFDSYVVVDEWKPSRRTLPDCWDYINVSTNVGDSVFPSMHSFNFNNYIYAHSAPNSLCLYIDKHGTKLQANPQYVILPAMHNINGLRVKLYARSYSITNMYSGRFKVGVMEETENGLEFIQIGQENTANTSFQLFTVDLSSYQGTGEHIAIWLEVPTYSSYGLVFIDDIVVEELPQFTMPVPAHGEVTGGWCLISSPLAEAVNPMNVSQLVAANAPDFDLYRFNPNPGITGSNWENWKSHANNDDNYHFDLVPGRGYLYANAYDVNLGFNGVPYEGNGEVTLQYDEDARFGGWNLVGNPFPVSTYIGDRAYYKMNEEGTGFVPVSDGSAIRAMEGIFVYTETDGEVVTFSSTPTATRGEQLSFNVSKETRAGLNTTFDRAILRFGEGDVLPKFQLNEASAKIYIPQNGMDYAVATAEGQGEMPVNFRADENGTYTLNFSIDNIEFSYLHLFDNKTGSDIDLLSTPSYTFNATTTDYESRFKLVYATGSSVAGDSFSFFNSNGNFSIFGIEGEATLQVYDVMGRVLSTETFNGSIDKQLNVAPGVYFIRLVNGDDVKTQKIVVR